jgi:hypothetical protein
MTPVISDDEHAAMVERHLTAVSTTCAELGITPGDVEAFDYEPPGAAGPHACLTLDLADGRRVEIAKDGRGTREFTWTPAPARAKGHECPLGKCEAGNDCGGPSANPEPCGGCCTCLGGCEAAYAERTAPAIPEPYRVALDDVRERLDQVRGQHRPTGVHPLDRAIPGEPTGHVVVRTGAEIPESIRDHAMYHHGPGVSRHPRLGIWVIVLDEIDPDRNGRKMLQALGDLGIAREKLAKVEREHHDTRAAARKLATALDHAHAELDSVRAALQKALRDGIVVNQQRGEARAEVERLRADVEGLVAEAERLRGTREATVTAIGDGIAALDVEHLTAYDAERVARVVGAAFRIDEVERLRHLLATALGDTDRLMASFLIGALGLVSADHMEEADRPPVTDPRDSCVHSFDMDRLRAGGEWTPCSGCGATRADLEQSGSLRRRPC